MAFARIQGGSNYSAPGAASIAATISAVGSGNCILGSVTYDGNASGLASVTDDKGNTYHLETAILDGLAGQSSCAFSLTNITNGPTVITANFSPSTSFHGILVDEFSGTSTASTDERDGTAHGGQYQATPSTATDGVSSGIFTTATNGDLLWGSTMSGDSPTAASNGTSFSTGTAITSSDVALQSEFRTQTTAGSGTAATFTDATGVDRVNYLIAIKPAAGGASGPVSKLVALNQSVKRASYW